jgi:hypothetical protein
VDVASETSINLVPKTSPRRSPRMQPSPGDSQSKKHTRSSRLSAGSAKTTPFVEESSIVKTTTESIPSSANRDIMNMKLQFESSVEERRREAIMLAPDPPPFNLDS